MASAPLRVAETKSSHQVLEIDIDAVIHAQARCDEGYTTQQWSDALGVGVAKIRKWLAHGIENGYVKHGVAMRKSFNGRMYAYDVYRYMGE